MAREKATFKTGMSWAKSLDKPIEDATDRLEVRIGRADVKEGVPMDQLSCAFSKGICRQEYAAAAWVGMNFAFVEWSDKVLRYAVPESVARELVSFDRAHLAEVGLFHLRPPDPTHRLGTKKPIGYKYSNPRKQQGKPHRTINVRNQDYQ